MGLELAQAYARFGVAVTVVKAMDRLLPGEEPESSDTLALELAPLKINVNNLAPGMVLTPFNQPD